MNVCYQNRRAAARARKAMQQLGLLLQTDVYVTGAGDVYVVCATRDPVARAMLLAEGELSPELPEMSDVVEMYRRESTVRFGGGTGGNVPVPNGAKRRA